MENGHGSSIYNSFQEFWRQRWFFVGLFLLLFFLAQIVFLNIIGHIWASAWIVILIGSAVIAHFFLSEASDVYHYFLSTRTHKEPRTELEFIPELQHAVTKESIKEAPSHTTTIEENIETKAHQSGVLISHDGMRIVADSRDDAMNLLNDLISRARKRYPKTDGWTLLNKNRITSLMHSDRDTDIQLESCSHVATKQTPIPANLPTGTLRYAASTAAGTFVELLCKGKSKELFLHIDAQKKSHEDAENEVRTFLTEVVLLLDDIRRHRLENVGSVEPYVLEKAQCFSNIELENVIAILAHGIDFRSEEKGKTAADIAVIRALEYVKNRKLPVIS